jgi:hypothetical protein
MKTKLQTVRDALLEHSRYAGPKTVEALAIIDELLTMNPVGMIRTLWHGRTFPLDAAYELPDGDYTLYAFKEVLK